MIICIVISFLAAILLGLYISEKIRGFTIKGVLRKTMVSFLFIVIAAIGIFKTSNIYSVLITIGLLFGLLGDIWLDLKYVHSDFSDKYTHAGFKSFAFGHILYIFAMVYAYGDLKRPLFLILPLALGTIMGFVIVALEKIMKLEYGKFRDITMVYGAFLFGDLFLACTLVIMNEFQVVTLNLMTVGLILFAVSDLVLSGTYFGKGKDRPIDIVLNYLTYYPGQFFIAWSTIYSTLGGR